MHIDIRQVGTHRLLYVMATNQEYGERLKALIKPVITGVGPVEAAMMTTRALSGLSAKSIKPSMVVSLGSAGSATLEQTKVYQASSVSYRDMDASPLGIEKGVTPFANFPAVLPLKTVLPDVPTATLSTGANIVSGAAYDNIDAQMVDMETFAIERACQFFSIPHLALRGISDGREELKTIQDWTQFLHIIDQNLAATIFSLEAHLSAKNPNKSPKKKPH